MLKIQVDSIVQKVHKRLGNGFNSSLAHLDPKHSKGDSQNSEN